MAVANRPGWVEQDGVGEVGDLPGGDEGQRRGPAAGRLALVRDDHVDPADVGLQLVPERRRGAAAGRDDLAGGAEGQVVDVAAQQVCHALLDGVRQVDPAVG